jgi:hypothetical protein
MNSPMCNDGKDNDLDGLIDQFDPGCRDKDGRYRQDYSEFFDSPDSTDRNKTIPCLDGIDNDKDGKTDQEDSDCRFPYSGEGIQSAIVDENGSC